MKAAFTIHTMTPEKVFLLDDCNTAGTMSVTNDAESVCDFCHKNYPGKRIIYKDSSGDWGELRYDSGQEVEFLPYHGEIP